MKKLSLHIFMMLLFLVVSTAQVVAHYEANATSNNLFLQSNVSETFSVLQAIGNAANQGSADKETLHQACNLLQQHGTVALQTALNKNFSNMSLLSGSSSNKIGSLIFAQGQNALAGTLASSCASLTGQGVTTNNIFDAEQLRTIMMGVALSEGLSFLKNSGLPFTGRLEIAGDLFSGGGANWEILTVQPLWRDASGLNHIFTQLSWNRTHDRKGYAEGDTFNAGLAWRRLSEDHTVVYGLNAFIDHARDRNHNRMSIGADVQTSQLSLSVNKYIPLSDWKSVDFYSEERSSSGFDVELQGRVPELPSWQLNLKGYQWSSNEDMEENDTWGYDAAVQWQPVNALVWEAGLRNEQDAKPQFHTGLRLIYRFGEPVEEMWERPLQLASVSERVYDKVRRDNAMRVERRIKDEAYITVTENVGANIAQLTSGPVSLFTGQSLPRPFTITVSAVPGSVARLAFRDGGLLTIGAGSTVRVEAEVITLISGLFQYVSGTVNVAINVPGGTVTLLGTDIDVSTNGTSSVLRVRDGAARLTGMVSGSTTLNVGQAAAAVNGVVGAAMATNDPAYVAHTDDISLKIDRVAAPQTGIKVAPYAVEAPRLTATATAPGQTITIALKLNAPVSVTGIPQLNLNVNGHARQAAYSTGTGTNDLTFSYTLQGGDAGATTVTVQGIDLNGGTITDGGKGAVVTIADTVLDLGGSVGDIVAPSGYAVAFTTAPITALNQAAAVFQITNAEIGATFNYTIASSGNGTNVTGSGTISTATQNVAGIDVSGLGDGTLTLSLTLTDDANNAGTAATATVAKNTMMLGLDFVNGAYSFNGTNYGNFTAVPGVMFTRASPSTTYAEDSAGNLVAFSANTPRVTDKGMLIEGHRTNFFQQSSTSTFSSIVGAGAPDTTFTANVTTAPDGTMTAGRFVNAGPTGTTYITREIPLSNAAGDSFTFSVFLKHASGSPVNVSWAGTSNVSGGVPSCRNIANGWQHCSITGTASIANALARPQIALAVSSSFYVWGPQVEAGPFASSYIPTTSTAVSRNADSARVNYVPSLPFSAYGAVEFGALGSGAGSNMVARFIGTSSDNRAILEKNTSSNKMNLWNGTTSMAGPISTSFANRIVKGASRHTSTGRAVTSDGLAPTSDNNTLPADWTYLLIGHGLSNNNFAYGYIRDIRIYESVKTNAELQALTSP